MKRPSFLVLLLAFLAVGCAQSPYPVSSLSSPTASFQPQLVMAASDSEQITLKSLAVSVTSESGSGHDKKNLDDVQKGVEAGTGTLGDLPESSKSSAEMSMKSGTETPERKENLEDGEKGEEEEIATIADPLEPFNRAMYHFNDKLYFWALKPAAEGYNLVLYEPARGGVNNFFSNLKFPIRFVNSLLQADFGGAATELGRFAVNTILGFGGLVDLSSTQDFNLPKRDVDLGQTLGVYGVGHGFYIVWPIIGPSSPRDSIGLAGDAFLYPVSYISPWYAPFGVRGYEKVNDASLSIGEYESLKEAAIDPYVALRDAYVQYRQHKVEARRGKPEPPKPAGGR